MVEFTGKVNGIVFENDKDLYKILDVEIIGSLENYSRDEIKVTGNFGDIQISASYRFEGKLVMHEKFGLQFRAIGERDLVFRQTAAARIEHDRILIGQEICVQIDVAVNPCGQT